MTDYFYDSSALIKRYMAEKGTAHVRAEVAPSSGNNIIVSRITQAEIISGVSRLKRESVITSRTAQAVRLLLNRQFQREYVVIELNRAIAEDAQRLLDTHPLRGFDAIQLASALAANARMVAAAMSTLMFVSGDVRLLNAATGEGLMTDNPNNYP